MDTLSDATTIYLQLRSSFSIVVFHWGHKIIGHPEWTLVSIEKWGEMGVLIEFTLFYFSRKWTYGALNPCITLSNTLYKKDIYINSKVMQSGTAGI